MAKANNKVAVLGIFVADTAFHADRLPRIGETIAGSGFILGPGGKGSNQAVAARRAGADVTFITRIGTDPFGDMAVAMWEADGIRPFRARSDTLPTGAAFIFVNPATGQNAIIVYAGAALSLGPDDLDAARGEIEQSSVFVAQLEQPPEAALRGLQIARAAGVTTIFNPAPAVAFDPAVYPLCDYITPNETEAAALTGVDVASVDDARAAGDVLLARGAGCALITLGEKGALLHSKVSSVLVPVTSAGQVLDTTGAGDAFNGGFASALARGLDPVAAARFASAIAGLSVTRRGAAASMPFRTEAEALLS